MYGVIIVSWLGIVFNTVFVLGMYCLYVLDGRKGEGFFYSLVNEWDAVSGRFWCFRSGFLVIDGLGV